MMLNFQLNIQSLNESIDFCSGLIELINCPFKAEPFSYFDCNAEAVPHSQISFLTKMGDHSVGIQTELYIKKEKVYIAPYHLKTTKPQFC